MEDSEKIMHHDNTPKEIGIVGVSFSAVEKRPETIDLHQTKETNDRFESDRQIEKIQRHQTKTIDVESRRVHVVMSQLDRIGLQNTVFEIRRAEVEDDIEYVEEITCVIEDEPEKEGLAGQFKEGETKDDDPEVVEKGKTDDRCPIVGQSTAGIEDEGETSSTRARRVKIELLEASFDVLFACFAQLTRLTDEITLISGKEIAIVGRETLMGEC